MTGVFDIDDHTRLPWRFHSEELILAAIV